MNDRVKSWFSLNAGIITVMGIILIVILNVTGLPVFPSIWIYLALTVGFCFMYLFKIAADRYTTVRCDLFGHKMLNTRLDNGVRTYECKRAACHESVKEAVK